MNSIELIFLWAPYCVIATTNKKRGKTATAQMHTCRLWTGVCQEDD